MMGMRRRALTALGFTLAATLVLVPGGALAASARSAVAVPTADYQFQSSLASADGPAPDLTPIKALGKYAKQKVDGAKHTVLTFAQYHGLALTPTTSIASSTTYSIVVLAQLTDTSGYRRLVDFKHGTVDTGLYSENGVLYFYDVASAPTLTITPGKYFQVVITRATDKTVTGYVDGVQQFSFKDTGKVGVIDGKATLRFFADDKTNGTEASAGAVARIRVYNSALTPSDVAALDREPLG